MSGFGKSSALNGSIFSLPAPGLIVKLGELDRPSVVITEALMKDIGVKKEELKTSSPEQLLAQLRRSVSLKREPIHLAIDEGLWINDPLELAFLAGLRNIPNLRVLFSIHPAMEGQVTGIEKSLPDILTIHPDSVNREAFKAHLAILMNDTDDNSRRLDSFLDIMGPYPRLIFTFLECIWRMPLVRNLMSAGHPFMSLIDLFAERALLEYELHLSSNQASNPLKELFSVRFDHILNRFIPASTKATFENKLVVNRAFHFEATTEELKTLEPLRLHGFLSVDHRPGGGIVNVQGEIFKLYLAKRYGF